MLEQSISLDEVVTFLVSAPFFDGLDAAERAEVVRILEVRRLADGEEFFHEGDPGDAWYVIYEGRVRVLKEVGGVASEVRVLEAGECFGEMAIIDGLPRSATVQALGPVTAFRFRRSRFEGLLDQGSLGAFKLILAMARMLSQRHRWLTQRLSELSTQGEPVLAGAGARDTRAPVTNYYSSE